MSPKRPIAPVVPINESNLAYRPIGLDSATLSEGSWADWQRANREVTIPHAFEWLERDGTITNLRRLDARNGDRGPRRGLWFSDSDLYKALEAVAWDSALSHAPDRAALMSRMTSIVARAQEEDGYINSFVQAGLGVRWENLVKSHEMYCIGHLIQAGIADKRASGRTELFDTARKAADLVVADFGSDRRRGTDGHPEIEMALVELYRETGEARYLDLAEQLIDIRGYRAFDPGGHFDNAYYQDATPVREEKTVVGHAVRAIYLLVGVVDLYIETGEQALLDAALRQWSAMNATKTYLNGAVGSRFAGEAFGDDYELPPDLAYGETCATIGNIMLSWRLLLITGQSRFADAIERALYNLFSASTSVERTGFFYNNPAQRRARYPESPNNELRTRADAPGTRPAWFKCACCPPNIMRTVASLSAYVASMSDSGVQIHQYMPSHLQFEISSGTVGMSLETNYPIDGVVTVRVDKSPTPNWTLSLRKPDWATNVTVEINGIIETVRAGDLGYLELTRSWVAGDRVVLQIPIEPRFTVAHPSVDAVRGAVAIERGPVVYAFESTDQPADVDLNHVEILASEPVSERLESIAGQRTVVLRATGYARDDSSWAAVGWAPMAARRPDPGRTFVLTAIPYALWANRGASVMRIFIPART